MYLDFVDTIKCYVIKGMMSATLPIFIHSDFAKFIGEIDAVNFDFFYDQQQILGYLSLTAYPGIIGVFVDKMDFHIMDILQRCFKLMHLHEIVVFCNCAFYV